MRLAFNSDLRRMTSSGSRDGPIPIKNLPMAFNKHFLINTQYSYSLGYTVAGVALSLTGTDADDNGNAAMKVGASYTMGNITVGVTSDDKGQNGNDRVNEVTASYVAGPATISVAAADDDSWSASVAYTAGAMSVNVGTDNNDEWDANVSYDLGGGVSLNAATSHAEYVAAGINFTF